MKSKLKNRAQQEMVGFVIIVVLVVVGLMVFLVISLRTSSQESNSPEVENLLTSLMRHTTDCAISFEPEYDSFKDLFKSCYHGLKCKNLGIDACEYLGKSLREAMENIMSSTNIDAYQISILEEDNTGRKGFMQIGQGCTSSSISSSQKNLAQGSNNLIIRLRLCNS